LVILILKNIPETVADVTMMGWKEACFCIAVAGPSAIKLEIPMKSTALKQNVQICPFFNIFLKIP